MQPGSAPRDNQQEHQIELQVDDQLAVATYEVDRQVITFMHTFVPEPLRGRGLATQLVEAGIESARTRGLKVVPQCPTFAAYMKAHPETHGLLAPAGRDAMGA